MHKLSAIAAISAAFVLGVTAIPVMPLAAQTENTCGEHLTWTLEDGVLTIAGTGPMTEYSPNPDGWFSITDNTPWKEDKASIQKVIVEEGVTTLTNSAFRNCTALTEVSLPDTLTAIGDVAFMKTAISALDVPASVTTFGFLPFQGTPWISELSAPLVINHVLLSVPANSETVSVPEGVTELASFAFQAARSTMTSVSLPTTLTKLDNGAFLSCSVLSALTLPDSLATMGADCFASCKALKSLTIPDGITAIPDGCMAQCISLEEIVLPDCVTEIGKAAFQNCTALQTAPFPAGPCKIGDCAFYGCTAITEAIIPAGNTWGIGAYAYCSGLTEIQFAPDMTEIPACMFYGCNELSALTLPEQITAIGAEAFVGCTKLTEVTLGKQVTEIGPYAFGFASVVERVKSDSSGAHVSMTPLQTTATMAVMTTTTTTTTTTTANTTTTTGTTKLDYSRVTAEPQIPFTLYGYTASAAEAYAQQWNVPFVALDKPLLGDLNLDHKLSVADLVLMQRYLLRSVTLEPAAAPCTDLNADGLANAFDLVLLRRMLLEQNKA